MPSAPRGPITLSAETVIASVRKLCAEAQARTRNEGTVFSPLRATRKPRPSYVETEQQIGDVRRLVEVPAPDKTVHVGALFSKIRAELPTE